MLIKARYLKTIHIVKLETLTFNELKMQLKISFGNLPAETQISYQEGQDRLIPITSDSDLTKLMGSTAINKFVKIVIEPVNQQQKQRTTQVETWQAKEKLMSHCFKLAEIFGGNPEHYREFCCSQGDSSEYIVRAYARYKNIPVPPLTSQQIFKKTQEVCFLQENCSLQGCQEIIRRNPHLTSVQICQNWKGLVECTQSQNQPYAPQQPAVLRIPQAVFQFLTSMPKPHP